MVVAIVVKLMTVRMSIRASLLFLLLVLPLLVLGYARWLDPSDDYVDQGVTGPYAAVEDGVTTDGRPRFKPGPSLAYVAPGQRYTWISSVCLELHTNMLAQTVQVRVRDRTEFPVRRVLITPDDRRCGPAVGSAIAPDLTAEDGPETIFELQRRAKVRATSWLPLNAPLRSLRFTVRRQPPASE